MDAITILLALLRVRALKPSTLAYLQPVVLQIQEQNRLTRGQLQMLNEISVRLEKQVRPPPRSPATPLLCRWPRPGTGPDVYMADYAACRSDAE